MRGASWSSFGSGFVLAAVLACSTAGCGAHRGEAVGDPLRPSTGTGAVFATVNCESKNADGTCNKATCKKDNVSDCRNFSKGCLQHDNFYSGTAEEGTCSRIL